ncbi:MAG: glyoxalase [Candidatus Diapherotrites archaeon]|nr:glyoxalase [Candidatus Diapherotrites archaeon]
MIEEKHSFEPEWITGELKYPLGRGINFQIEVKNLNELSKNPSKNRIKLYSTTKENKYKVGKETFICRELMILDPDGYLLRFSQTRKSKQINDN